MKILAVALVLTLLFALYAYAAEAQQRKINREGIEWTDVWMPDSNANDLPRVLLIGDSITRAYYPDVEKLLKGKAYCARIATSKAIGDPALPKELGAFLSEGKFAVIHFNIGMHGWAYSEDEYRKYLPELLDEFRKDAPSAKLIWASTTPVRKDRDPGPSNERIAARNAIAKEFFAAQGIPIDDLNTLMSGHEELHSDDVHFNAAGSSLAAKQVADQIMTLLPAPAKP